MSHAGWFGWRTFCSLRVSRKAGELSPPVGKDVGQTSRLRIIRDRFTAGHNSCESHADSDNHRVGRPVPERALPIDTVSDANGGGVGRVATAVPTSPTMPDQLEKLLR